MMDLPHKTATLLLVASFIISLCDAFSPPAQTIQPPVSTVLRTLSSESEASATLVIDEERADMPHKDVIKDIDAIEFAGLATLLVLGLIGVGMAVSAACQHYHGQHQSDKDDRTHNIDQKKGFDNIGYQHGPYSPGLQGVRVDPRKVSDAPGESSHSLERY